ncbi:hypothetical protein EYF80_041236 [Liparis tanakae]|uniref:Uncharacterized protein n=1 Tax=Liparis tanakae TaxID=230148 RepID=A0A4Z2G5X1_9TELE|nr:hypothetical protein EYF80_041236 [Liparis tanakae]
MYPASQQVKKSRTQKQGPMFSLFTLKGIRGWSGRGPPSRRSAIDWLHEASGRLLNTDRADEMADLQANKSPLLSAPLLFAATLQLRLS